MRKLQYITNTIIGICLCGTGLLSAIIYKDLWLLWLIIAGISFCFTAFCSFTELTAYDSIKENFKYPTPMEAAKEILEDIGTVIDNTDTINEFNNLGIEPSAATALVDTMIQCPQCVGKITKGNSCNRCNGTGEVPAYTNNFKIFKENAGVISKISEGPVWVCICEEYMYTANTLKDLITVLNTEWKSDKNLVG